MEATDQNRAKTGMIGLRNATELRLSADDLEALEERAAILEYEAGFDRQTAEARAREMIERERRIREGRLL